MDKTRALAGVGMALALVAAGCGGGGGSKAKTTSATTTFGAFTSRSTTPVVTIAPTTAAPTTIAGQTVASSPGGTLAPGGTTAVPSVAGATTYTVTAGDTLGSIASKFGVTVASIAQLNNLTDINNLRPGQKLLIPPKAPTTTARPTVPVASGVVYAVVSGDTLAGIAAKFGVSLTSLKTLNNLTTDTIIVGQKLQIPAKTGAPAGGATTTAAAGAATTKATTATTAAAPAPTTAAPTFTVAPTQPASTVK